MNKREIETQGRRPCERAGKDSSGASESHGMLRITYKHRKLGESRKDSSQQPSEGAWPCLNTLVLDSEPQEL